MGLPQQPLTLSIDQIDTLNQKLSEIRHDINNQLSIMMAAAELVRLKPEMAPRLSERLIGPPGKIKLLVREFSDEFERTLGITRS